MAGPFGGYDAGVALGAGDVFGAGAVAREPAGRAVVDRFDTGRGPSR